MGVSPWSPAEEDFLSAWHQALAKGNPFLVEHPHPAVQEVHSLGFDVREVMLLHDCFLKDHDPLRLLERELPETVLWPWDAEGYQTRLDEVSAWAQRFYKTQNVEITERIGHAEPEDY